MKLWIKAAICIALSLMCVFSCIGYAALSTTLTIRESVESLPPNAVFITAATTSGTTGGSTTVNNFSMTVITSDTQLGSDKNSTATLHITVYNNTIDYHAFKGVHYNEGDYTYDNPNITMTVRGFDIGEKLAPKSYANIDITFRYDSYQGFPESLLSTLELHFGLSGAEDNTDYESYISNFLTNINGYGLNDTDKKGTEVFNNLKTHTLLYADDNLKGGNLKHLINAVNTDQTEALTFVYQYVSETKVVLFTYEEKYNISNYNDTMITVYKTTFVREQMGSTYSEWKHLASISGKANIEYLTTPGGTRLYAINIDTWEQTV